MDGSHLSVSQPALAEFCREHHIRKLSLFGSVLREDFGAESDVDVLVEFEPHHPVGLIRLSRIERELSALLGRKVDLTTPGFFRSTARATLLQQAQVQYVAP